MLKTIDLTSYFLLPKSEDSRWLASILVINPASSILVDGTKLKSQCTKMVSFILGTVVLITLMFAQACIFTVSLVLNSYLILEKTGWNVMIDSWDWRSNLGYFISGESGNVSVSDILFQNLLLNTLLTKGIIHLNPEK